MPNLSIQIKYYVCFPWKLINNQTGHGCMHILQGQSERTKCGKFYHQMWQSWQWGRHRIVWLILNMLLKPTFWYKAAVKSLKCYVKFKAFLNFFNSTSWHKYYTRFWKTVSICQYYHPMDSITKIKEANIV